MANKTEIFIVNAYRWGNNADHSYTVGAFDSTINAIECADSHNQYRGGKYTCVVEKCILNHFENDADDHTTEVYKS